MIVAASRHRHAPGLTAPLFALAAGPAGWIVQLVAGYGLSSYACFPRNQALGRAPPPGWPHEKLLLVAINLGGLALVTIGLAVAVVAWRGAGDDAERFLARCAMFGCGLFAIAALFDTVMIAATPTCWSFQ